MSTDPDPVVDLIRMMLIKGTEAHLADATRRAGLTPHDIGLLRRAYRSSGDAAVHTTLYPTDADPDLLAQAAADIVRQRASRATLHVERNRITDHAVGVQIRLEPDQRWYPYTSERENWAPARHPDPSPATAYAAALQARRARSRI